MAYGAIAAAKYFDLRIPEDVAIAGFDNNPSSAHTEPSLTTVIQPFYEMGRRATTLLLSLLDDPQPSNGYATHRLVDGPSTLDAHALRVKMPATLVVRASSSKPPG
jgi:LacI family transcriptional regulator